MARSEPEPVVEVGEGDPERAFGSWTAGEAELVARRPASDGDGGWPGWLDAAAGAEAVVDWALLRGLARVDAEPRLREELLARPRFLRALVETVDRLLKLPGSRRVEIGLGEWEGRPDVRIKVLTELGPEEGARIWHEQVGPMAGRLYPIAGGLALIIEPELV